MASEEEGLPIPVVQQLVAIDTDLDAPKEEPAFVLAKAAELFVQQLAERAGKHMQKAGKQELQYNDVAAAADQWETVTDLLVDIVPKKVRVSDLLKKPEFVHLQHPQQAAAGTSS